MTGEKYESYVEYGMECFKGPLPPYGCGDGNGESFRYDYRSAESDSGDGSGIKLVAEDGSISYVEPRKPVEDDPKYAEPDLTEK